MRALTISAFAMTLLLSAITVFFALNSDHLDGEPHAIIAIDPPIATVLPEASAPTPARVRTTPTAKIEQPQSVEPAETVRDDPVPEPVLAEADPTADQPARNPGQQDASEAPVETLTNASETIAQDTANAQDQRRPTEVAQPIVENAEPQNDPFFAPAEPGIGLGVGNLGPLTPTTN